MYALIDSVARVTRGRDRDVLEASIIEVLADVVRPESLRLFKVVAMGDRRVVHCSVESLGEQPLRLNAMPPRAGGLPPLELFPWVLDWFDGGTPTPVEYQRPNGWCYIFPIADGAGPCGWIELEHPVPLDAQERRLVAGMLRIFANHLAVIDYGERDSLTGLPNRKTFDYSFQKGLSGMVGSPTGAGGPEPAADEPGYWLGVIDIDFFKRVNDQFGHLYGDEVLVLLARCMTESFRLADRLFRFGGEEFAILLDRTLALHAGEVFDRFREKVANVDFPQIGRVTISIGYTRIRADDTSTLAFDRADAALYHAKKLGRNRVCSWDELASAGEVKDPAASAPVEFF